MSAQERSNVITRVEETRWGKRKLLTQLQVPKSNYYRWRARALQGKQDSRWRARALQGKQDSATAVPGFPGISLAHRKRPQYWRRPGSFRSGVAGNWPLGSPTT